MLRRISRGAVFLFFGLLAACSSSKPALKGGVEIYLTRTPLNGAAIRAADVSKLDQQDEPIIAAGDILAYHLQNHEIELSKQAMQRLYDLKIRVDGLGFVITADGKPVYGGAFWTALSSLSYEGVTIMLPFNPDQNSVRLATGYPTGDMPGADAPLADDPRNDRRVIEALRQAGVLKE